IDAPAQDLEKTQRTTAIDGRHAVGRITAACVVEMGKVGCLRSCPGGLFMKQFSNAGLAIVVAVVVGSAAIAHAEDDYRPITPSAPPDLTRPHPFGVHDMVRMQRVGEPVPSPDGRWVVFTVRAWDAETNKATTNLWLLAGDGSGQRQLTSGKAQSDTSP